MKNKHSQDISKSNPEKNDGNKIPERYKGLDLTPVDLPAAFFDKFPEHKAKVSKGLSGLQKLLVNVTLFELGLDKSG